MTITEAIEDALEGLGKVNTARAIIEPAVGAVAKDMAKYLVSQGTEDPAGFFNGDPVHDRSVMRGVALANTINSSIDWMAVPAEVLKASFTVLKVASLLAPLI